MIAGLFSSLQQRMNAMASSVGNSINKFGTAMSPIFTAALTAASSAATQSIMLGLAQQIGNMNNPLASNVLNAISPTSTPQATIPTNPTV